MGTVLGLAAESISQAIEVSSDVYQEGFLEIFSRYSGKLLAVDEAPTIKEGDWLYTRTVLIEFPDADAFDAWFDSPEYQGLAEHRRAASTGSIAVIKKYTAREG